MKKIHTSAYREYDQAVDFICHRNDNPQQKDDFNWESDRYQYSILQLNLKK